MAQNVERNVNINVTANANQADRAMQDLWGAFVKLNDITLELSKNTSSIDSGSLKELESTYKQLSETANAFYESQLINKKQMEGFAESYNKSWLQFLDIMNKDNPLYTSINETTQKVLDFQKIMGSLETEIKKLESLKPTSLMDENGISKIYQANELFDRLFGIIQKLRENGTIDFSERKQLFNTLINGFSQYREELDKTGMSIGNIERAQKTLADTINFKFTGVKYDEDTLKISKETTEELRKQSREYETALANKKEFYAAEQRINDALKQREATLQKEQEIQENLNKTYSELGGGGLSAPDGAFEDSIQNLADLNNVDTTNFFELFNQLGIGDKLLQKFSSELGISAKDLKALAEAAGITMGSLVALVTAIGAVVVAIKLLVDQAQDMKKTFDNVALSLGDFAGDSFKWFVDSLESVVDIADAAIQKLDELADAGINLERAFLTTSAYIGKDATDQVYNFIDSISGASNTMFQNINEVVVAAGSMGLASDQLVDVTKNMTIMGRNLGVLIGDTQKAFTDLGITITKGYVGRNSILYKIFTKQEIDQVRALGSEVERYNFILERSGRVQDLYNEYIQTAAGKVSLLRMQWQELLTNIGTIALNLYAIVAPVLTQLLQIANQLLSVFIKVFNWEPKSVGFNSVAADIGNSLSKITGAADKATKKLASFDDVIQISEDSKGSGVGDVGDLGALGDFSNLLGDVVDQSNELEDIWAKFRELMEAGDYFGAGKEFMQVITDLLRKIPWDDIQEKARSTGKAIAQFLNGIFDVSSLDGLLNWRFVGETIAEALNTIIAAVGSFLKEFDFNMMGKALGQAWDSLWDNLDIDGAAEALYEAFMGVFEFVNGWLEGGGLSRMAQGIADFIGSFFSNFDIETDTDTIVNAISGVIDDIINALYIIAEALTSDDVKEVVFTLITKLVNAFKDNAEEWGTKLGTIAKDILSFIEEAIETADKAGLEDAMSTFLDSLDLGNILQRYITLKIRIWWEGFKYKLLYNLKAVGGIIWESLQNTLGALLLLIFSWGVQITGWWADMMVGIRTFLSNIISAILTFFANLGSTVLSLLSQVGANIFSAVTDIWDGIKKNIEFKIETIKLIFTTLWDFVKGIFDGGNWIDLGKQAIEALWQGIKDIWNNTIGSWSFDIPGIEIAGKKWDGIHFAMPKLATGGIVTGPTTALIGEAGAEAVLPLKNNTQWMDILASKVANQISNGNGMNGGTIKLELTDKPFYTRAEMYEFGALVAQSLNAYGINIAVV